MTNVIAGFSQQKLVELNINLLEAMLLNWFVKFYSAYDSKNQCEAMPKYYFKDDNNNIVAYGWVKNSYVIEQLPILGITNEKVIARHFEHLTEVGIFSKKIINSQRGKRCLYHLNGELYNCLITCEERKVDETKTIYLQNNVSSQKNKTPVITLTEIPKTKNTVNNIKPQGTQECYAEGTQECHTEGTQEYHTEGTQECHTEGTQECHTEGTQECHALNDSLVNDSLVNNSLVSDNNVAVATLLNNSVKKLFGENAFDASFIPKATAFLKTKKIKPDLYCSWLKKRVDTKKPDKPRGLFYNLFFQDDIAEEFRANQKKLETKKLEEEKKQQQLEAKKRLCPVCGKYFIPKYDQKCPECNLYISDFSNKELVQKKIRFRQLSKDLQESYENEYKKLLLKNRSFETIIFNKDFGKKIKEVETMLDKKYGLTDKEVF